jgi:hypothetical protein
MEKKRSMWQKFTHEFEHLTDHIIPYLVIILAIVLILENPFWTLYPLSEHEPWMSIFDGIVVFFFVADLVFKWFQTKNIRTFFKLYWLDMIAVFPFYLAFRAYEQVAAIFAVGEEVALSSQKVAHEAVLLRETKLIQEAEQLAKETRIAKEAELLAKEAKTASRGLRGGQNILRVMKGRLYASHRAMVAIHNEHAKDHKEGY